MSDFAVRKKETGCAADKHPAAHPAIPSVSDRIIQPVEGSAWVRCGA